MLESGKVITFSHPSTYDYTKHRRVLVDPQKDTEEPHAQELTDLVEKYRVVTNLNSSEVDKELDKLQPIYCLEGVYMITTCDVTESIFRLRVVGSKTGKMFAKAIDHYRLWDFDESVEALLTAEKVKEDRAEAKSRGENMLEAAPLLNNDEENVSRYHAIA